jgi:hypothetical protein
MKRKQSVYDDIANRLFVLTIGAMRRYWFLQMVEEEVVAIDYLQINDGKMMAQPR